MRTQLDLFSEAQVPRRGAPVGAILIALGRWAPPLPCSAHYPGLADELLIRTLREKHYRVSIMAMRQAIAPPWVVAYCDGEPLRYHVLLQDIPLDQWQLKRLDTEPRPGEPLAMSMSNAGNGVRAMLGRRRRRPEVIVLWGEALVGRLPKSYAWRKVGPLKVGKL